MVDAFEDKRRSLEEEFFARHNRELAEAFKAKQDRLEAIQALSEVSGISETSVLESLYEAKISVATIAALSLAPLVLVAWADGSLDQAERKAILDAAAQRNIQKGHPAYGILEGWLLQAPGPGLFEAWKHYVRGLKTTLPSASYAHLHTEIMERAEAVAAAAGGFLGLGSKVSAAEATELERLKQTFAH